GTCPFFDTPQTPEKPLFLQRVNGYEPYQASSLTFLSPLEVLNRLKAVLETHLISSDIFPEEKLSQLPSEGKEIIKFAGIWEDIPEEDFINFCEEVEQRRQNSLSRRFEI
ncbi:MAG: hypothetical protein EWV63_05265, partial [Microcystis aeruginosa Ma_OC_H_19870700_S124]